jgi:GeoRSP system SPASM domain protein
MNLKELTWPVRIYWDLPENPSDPIRCRKICDELIEMKVLFLSLRDTAPAVSQGCRDVLEKLKGNNIGLSLTVSGSALTQTLPGLLLGVKLKTLLAEAFSFSQVSSLPEKARGIGTTGLPFGISFEVGRDNYHEIPQVVSFCLKNGMRDLVFPIQRLAAKRELFYIKTKEREELALKLGIIDFRMLRVTIHDPFLWKVFYPDTDYHEGGCQAANSMLYIDSEYRVYPCPAMSIELGDLQETTLDTIVLSAKKKDLRRSLLNPPAECAACDQVSKCLGGCRGRAFASADSLSRRDPACE